MADVLEIGDPIEVEFVTLDGQFWRPGTVCMAKGLEIGVAFADFTRLALQVHGRIRFRRAKSETDST